MIKSAPEWNNRCERSLQASSSRCKTDAQLVRVPCQRGNQRRHLSENQSLGLDTRADCLWHRIADDFNCEQSNEPKQPILQDRAT